MHKKSNMKRKLRLMYLCQFMVLGLLMLSAGCKKSNNSDDQPETAAALKTRIVAKWKLVGGSYTEYDAQGAVVNTQDLSGQDPVPVYDFRENDRYYVTDSGDPREFFYTVSTTPEGKSRILVDSSQYYDITLINSTDMTWISEIKATDEQPGTIRRAYTEVHFKKI